MNKKKSIIDEGLAFVYLGIFLSLVVFIFLLGIEFIRFSHNILLSISIIILMIWAFIIYAYFFFRRLIKK